MSDSTLPPPARASGVGESDRIAHRAEWRVVHVGFDVVYVSTLVLLAVLSVNVAVSSVLRMSPVVVAPRHLFEPGLATLTLALTGIVLLAWLGMLVGTVMLARAPGHFNLKVYAGLGALLLILGVLFHGAALLAGLALIVLYMHGLGRAWYYQAMRRHGVVLLVALGLLALALYLTGTRIPPALAFGGVVHPWHHGLPLGAPVALIMALLPWWLWGLWMVHVVALARRVTSVIQHPKHGSSPPPPSMAQGG